MSHFKIPMKRLEVITLSLICRWPAALLKLPKSPKGKKMKAKLSRYNCGLSLGFIS